MRGAFTHWRLRTWGRDARTRMVVSSSINGSMPVGLFGLAGDLLLADSNCDVHEKAVAQSSEVNNFGTSVVLH